MSPVETDPGRPADRVLEHSLGLFAVRGYPSTSVRDIADACGVTSGALYNHFASKDEILHALVSRAHDRLDAALDAAGATGEDPVTDLAALTSAFSAYHARWQQESRVAERDYALLPEPQRAEIVERRRAVLARFEDEVARGAAAGRLSLPPAPGGSGLRLAVMSILTMGIGVAEWFDPAGLVDPEGIGALHAGFVLRMLAP